MYRRKRRVNKYLTKSYIKSKRSNKSQSKQILALQKQIKGISRKLADRIQYSQFQIENNQIAIGHGVAPSSLWQPAVFLPIVPDDWKRIFQTEDAGQLGNKFRGRSIGFEHMIQLNTIEEDGLSKVPVTCTLMCVTLRKETALQTVQLTNELVDYTQNNDNYVLTSMGTVQGSGMCMINKGQFKIRYSKRFIIGALTDFADGTPTNNLNDNNKRIYTRLSYRNLIKSGIGSQGFEELGGEDIEPTDHLIWLLFHNAYGTQTLSWHTNCVITGRITN